MARLPLLAIVLAVGTAFAADDPLLAGLRARLAGDFIGKPDAPVSDISPAREQADAAGVRRDFDALLLTADRARLVQRGRAPGDDLALYQDMIRFVAKELKADPAKAVAVYGKRVQAATAARVGTNQLALRESLLRELAPQLEPARREAVLRKAGDTAARLEALVRRDSAASLSALAATADARPAEPTGEQALAATYGPGAAALTAEELAALPPRVQPTPLRVGAVPDAPPATAAGMSWSTVLSYFDYSRAKEIAAATADAVVGFTSRCYYNIKAALIDAGVLKVAKPQDIGKLGIGSGSAYMFARDLNRDPKKLDRLKLRRVDAKTMDWKGDDTNYEGLILVWGRGCAGFSAEHGHIETVVARSHIPELPRSEQDHLLGKRGPRGGWIVSPRLQDGELMTCSDGCTGHSPAFLRTYGRTKCLNVYAPVTDLDPKK